MIKAPSSSWECRLALWLAGKNLTSVFWFVFCMILFYLKLLFSFMISFIVLAVVNERIDERIDLHSARVAVVASYIWCCRWSGVEDHKRHKRIMLAMEL